MKCTSMSFEQLDAWKQARTLTRSIYALTRKGRLARDYGLNGQAQRAGVSVMSNVAEGYERLHVAEKLQFYNVAAGSAGEVRSLSYVIEDNYPELAGEAVELREHAHRSSQIIAGLVRSTEARRLSKPLATMFALLVGIFALWVIL